MKKFVICLLFPTWIFAQSFKVGSSAPFYTSSSLNKSEKGVVVHTFQNALQNQVIGAYIIPMSAPNAAANQIQLQVYQPNGALRWAKTFEHGTDRHFPTIAIHAETGLAAIAIPETGYFSIWDNGETSRKSLFLFDKESVGFDLEKSIHIEMSADGKRIAVAAMRDVDRADVEADNAQLFMFDERGSLLWKRPISLPALSDLVVNNAGLLEIRSYHATASDVEIATEIVDWNGNLQNKEQKMVANPRSSFTPSEVNYPYPLKPFNEPHSVTGSFGEYRGPTDAHFHNGTDIPDNDGTNVYAVADAVVSGISTTGVNAYIRAGDNVYVHIIPNPALPIGTPVKKGETVIGTILSGQGHVHLSEGPAGAYLNAIRPTGGLTPFVDTWKPVISNLKFWHLESGQSLTANALAGNVKITMQVRDPMAALGNSDATQNNGAYIVGYDIRKRDRTTVAFSPTADGIVFRFDSLPTDANVHFVFDPNQSSSSAHHYIVTNKTTSTGAWNTTLLPEGDYTVRVFARDSRGNEEVVFTDVSIVQRDLIPPAAPVLLSASLNQGVPRFEWTQTSVSDLAGFRLYGSATGTNGQIIQNESRLNAAARTTIADALLQEPTYYYLAALDQATPPNLSLQSDVYGTAPDVRQKRILIVDGFDRWTGSASWKQPFHNFVSYYGKAIAKNKHGFDSCANEAILSGKVSLQQYDAVFWLLGDESTADETFSDAEQALVKAYLENGGRLFVSGSEIAWDLGAKGSANDIAFLKDYLKAQYAGDASEYYQADGASKSIFEGIRFEYGSAPYTEDFPDYITAASGSIPALVYGNGRIAGVQYAGTFGNSAQIGKVIYLAFPFETISSETAQQEIVRKALSFLLDEAVTANEDPSNVSGFSLHPNFPNPFSSQTQISFNLAQSGEVKAEIFDLLGRKVQTLVHEKLSAGEYSQTWTPQHLASGVYVLRVDVAGKTMQQMLHLIH
jgi:murein DD-endopeptidase MepM/ murein hydrolase activator NlpD